MSGIKNLQTRKSLVVITALIIGFLMPYISRIPLAFRYRTPWIWKYMNDSDDMWRWNILHAASLLPIVIFGAIYIFTEFKWQFYTSAIAHFAITAFVYYNFMETYGRDDFLGFIVFPPVFILVSTAGGILGLAAQIIADKRKNIEKLSTETL